MSAQNARRHGHTSGGKTSPTYSSWKSMMQRCYNTNHPRYTEWGGRGITVCDRWDRFENFLTDMGERPEKTTLDREDNDKGYSPDNCRWATRIEQAQNTKAIIWVEIDGERRCLKEWCRIRGVDYVMVYTRVRRGMDPLTALNKPKRR